jgi:hypothetical protein
MSALENNPDLDKELERKKKELENKKLSAEIKNLSFDRWKFVLSFVPIIGLLITIIFQLNEFRFKEEAHQDSRIDAIESDYRAKFFSHPGDLEHQLAVSKDACENNGLSEDTKLNYCQKIPDLEYRISEKKKLDSLTELQQSQDLSDEDKMLSQEINSLDSLKEVKIEELKTLTASTDVTKSNTIKKEISSLDRQIDVIIGQSDVIKKTLIKSDSIDEAQRKIIGVTFTKNTENTILIEEESWFKVGYFRQFGETRISLEQFESNIATIAINLVKPKTNKVTEEIGTFTLKQGEKESIETDEFIYEIIFQRIGTAGKSPFSKAVYFGYRKYKLQA